MKYRRLTKPILIFVALVGIYIFIIHLPEIFMTNDNVSAALIKSNGTLVIKEAPTLSKSNNKDFWLSSGGEFYFDGNVGHTIIGDLPKFSKWRLAYNSNNPVDTDNGYHPQNLLRLINKNKILNSTQEFYFLIANDNFSHSPNRNESNGVFSINRYVDSNNLYYAGLRVDGTAVIKKKINGVYYTLAQTPLFSGDAYNRSANPSLLPKNSWMGVRTIVRTENKNQVRIELWVDKENDKEWEKVLSVLDDTTNGTPPFLEEGHGGIRGDFMDLEIKDYSFKPL